MHSRIKMSKLYVSRTEEQVAARRSAHKSPKKALAYDPDLTESLSGNSPLYVFPPLKIGPPGTPLEREADEVARRVVGALAGSAGAARQPRPAEEGPLSVSPEVADRVKARSGQGESIPAADLEFFEPRFGRDFGEVTIHRDAEAASLARSLNAKAFTVGSDIYFGEGQYSRSEDGRRLMAHELTHTVQREAVVQRAPKEPVNLPFATKAELHDFLFFYREDINKILTNSDEIDTIQFESYGGAFVKGAGEKFDHISKYENAITSTERKIKILNELKKSPMWAELTLKERARVDLYLNRGKNIAKFSRGIMRWVQMIPVRFKEAGVALPFMGINIHPKERTRAIDIFRGRAKIPENVKKIKIRPLAIAGTAFTVYSVYAVWQDPLANKWDIVMTLLPWGDGMTGYERALSLNLSMLAEESQALNAEAD